MPLGAVGGQSKLNALESDVLPFLMMHDNTASKFSSTFVSIMCGKYVRRAETNPSAVEGRGPTNLLYTCARSATKISKKIKNKKSERIQTSKMRE